MVFRISHLIGLSLILKIGIRCCPSTTLFRTALMSCHMVYHKVHAPCFFLLYVNDINSAISSSYFHLYADDTIIIIASNCTTSFVVKTFTAPLVVWVFWASHSKSINQSISNNVVDVQTTLYQRQNDYVSLLGIYLFIVNLFLNLFSALLIDNRLRARRQNTCSR